MNRDLQSLHEGSLEISLPVPLRYFGGVGRGFDLILKIWKWDLDR